MAQKLRALALVALLLTGCSQPASPPGAGRTADEGTSPAPGPGGEAVVGEVAEPRDLNCLRASDGPSRRICRQISDSLIDFDKEFRFVPRLAESFESSPDGMTLTFHLRRGVQWHDGEPFTARDVLYTVERIQSHDSAIKGNLPALFEPLARVTAPDDYTVVARYEEPFALAYHAWRKAFIMPAHLPFEPGEETPLSRSPLGTGPFRFVKWEPGVQVALEANDSYFAGRPRLDRLIYRVVPDPRTLIVGLRTGTLDLAWLNPADAPAEDADLPFTVRYYPGLMLDCIIWNTREKPGLFRDPRVRRALSLALDRQAYIDHVTDGRDQPAVSSFHPAMWAHDPALKPLPHDPAEAARLLAEAGWRDRDGDEILDTPAGPAAFTLLFSSGLPAHEKIATLVKEALEPLGIEVRLQGLDWASLLKKTRDDRTFHAAVKRWGLDLDPDPYDFFHSSEADAGQNYGGYSNPEVDRLSEEGRRTLHVERRAGLYHRVERILREEQPYTFISHPAAALGMSRRMRGVEVGPAGEAWYPATLDWWVESRRPQRQR